MVGAGLVAVPLLSRYLDDVAQTAVWAYWWVGLAMAGLVVLLIGSPPTLWWSRMFSAPGIVYVGKISYGIYLLHDLTFAFLDKLPIFSSHHHSWILSLGIFGLRVLVVIGIASVSWHFFERPLLRLKDKIAPVNQSEVSNLLVRPVG
jgi:peptidoglycan/LPS O-acetylase OafA/YrhL